MSSPLLTLRNNIKERLEKKHWNQARLATELGWPSARVSEYMNKTEPGLDKIAAIATVLGTDLPSLMREGPAQGHTIEDCMAAVEAAVRGTAPKAQALPFALVEIAGILAPLDEPKRKFILDNLLSQARAFVAGDELQQEQEPKKAR